MTAGSDAASVFVYVSCAKSKEICSFRLNQDSGELDPIAVDMVPGAEGPSRSNIPIVFSPVDNLLYAAIRAVPNPVSTYAIDPSSGKLTWRADVPMDEPVTYMSTSRNGRFLLGASYSEDKLTINRIGADGSVQAPASQVLPAPVKVHCILESRHNVIYVPTVGGNCILLFRLDETSGTLVPLDPPSMPFRPQSKPRHLKFHPRLDVLYCVTEYAGTLAAFAIDPRTGALAELQYEALVPPGYDGNARAADVQVTADGRFVYATVRNTHTIVAFRIDQDSGRLTRIGSFEAPPSPRSVALDPRNRFMFCAGEHDNTINVFAIDPDTGALTRLHSYPVGLQPTWVEAVCLPYKLNP